MKKLILFLLFLCIQLAVQGQTTYRYWFDNDESSLTEGSSSSSQWHMDIDVSKLTESIHQLHFQIADKDGNWSSVVSHWFVKNSQNSVYCTYWFDEDNANLHHADVGNGQFDIDVSTLPEGLHAIHFQMTDKNGTLGSIDSRLFLKSASSVSASRLIYWFDEDNANLHHADVGNGRFDIDVSTLPEGWHAIHFQMTDKNGTLGSIDSRLFFKTESSVSASKLIYWFDDEEANSTIVELAEGATEIDVTEIEYGEHTINYRVLCSNGFVSEPLSADFMNDYRKSFEVIYLVDNIEFYKDRVFVGDSIQLIEAPAKEGYTFEGWSEAPDSMPENDVTITGTYRINTYTIIYKVDGVGTDSMLVEYNSIITPMVSPAKEGYTFSGWSEIPETMPANDVIVTGSFSVNKYMLTYVQDGEEIYSVEVTYGDSIVALEVPNREGYTFSGWSEIPETMPANDVTVTGAFTINKYMLTYVVDGEAIDSVQLDYQASVTPKADLMKEGYTFSGWSEIPETMPANDVVVTGSFTVNTYMLTYYVDGVAVDSAEVTYGAKITPKEEPIRVGETFSGWMGEPDVMPAHDVVVSGTFGTNFYHLTYMVDGEIFDEGEVAYGSSIVPLSEPTKVGHTFSGWSEMPETMPASDVTVTGSFAVNKYMLTYVVDGEAVDSMLVEYGATITPVEEPAREGYTFSGWSEIPETMPAHDVVVNGSFNTNFYHLTYIVDGEVIEDSMMAYGSTIAPLAEPSRNGYVFSGWSNVPELMPAHDVTITGTLEIDYLFPDENGELAIDNTDGTLFFRLKNEEGVTNVRINGSIDLNDANLISTLQNLLVIHWESDLPMPSKLINGVNKNLIIFLNGKASIEGATGDALPVNVVRNGYALKMVLSDYEPLLITEEFTAKEITFTRKFAKKTKVGSGAGWESIVLPYDVEIGITEDGRYLAPFGSDKATHANVTPFWLAQYTSNGFTSATEIKANVPYIISMPNSDEYDDRYNVIGNVVFRGKNVSVRKTRDVEVASSLKYTFTPTYDFVEPAMNVYVINDEQMTMDGEVHAPGSVFVSNSGSARPFEVYFSVNSMSAAPRFIRIFGDDAVGIDGVDASKQSFAPVYNLNGQKVDERYRGIVIESGRKRMQ